MATPVLAAEPIKIGVGGYYIFYALTGAIEGTYALNGNGSTQYKGLQFIQEGEIHFTGQTKLDNGTTVGLQVQLEGWDPSVAAGNRQIDEAYLFAFGDWGRVEPGGRDRLAGPRRQSHQLFFATCIRPAARRRLRTEMESLLRIPRPYLGSVGQSQPDLRLCRCDDGERLPDQRLFVSGHGRRRGELREQVR
jgi:hypothetical protein